MRSGAPRKCRHGAVWLRKAGRWRFDDLLKKMLNPAYYPLIGGFVRRSQPGARLKMAGKRHASEEILAKLAQADELAAKGKTQRDISKALGVSIMTYHRWKKMVNTRGAGRPERPAAVVADVPATEPPAGAGRGDGELKRLEVENGRLRRLVTDMLLEKMRLEDELRSCQDAPLGRPGKGK